jgi:hypothetical protein
MGAAPHRAVVANLPQYQRRRPEHSPRDQRVQRHYETFAAEVERAATGVGFSTSAGQALPQFVKDEFVAYL